MVKGLMVLYGKNSVYERLKANPKSIKNISVAQGFDEKAIEDLAKKNHIPFERLPLRELEKIRPTKDLQGIIAKADQFQYVPFDDLLEISPEGQKIIPIFLDRINDPQNLGVIIRITACFGGFAIIIPEHEACAVNETVLHVACGGENYVKVCMVTNIAKAIIEAKKSGFWIVGADAGDEARDIHATTMPFPLALVMGSEGEGIRTGIQKHLDIRARIPMGGAKLSFNVGMACAIFCYEISRRKGNVL